MKRINISLLLIFSFICFYSYSQISSGLMQGLSVTIPESHRVEDLRYQEQMDRMALEMRQAQYEKNVQIKKEKAIANINQVKSYYASLTSYPTEIPNGWYTVISTNNYDICVERKVYVENNKITKYFIEDWIDRKVSFSTNINNAKAMLQLVLDNGNKADMVDVYFLEYINNKNAYTAAPVGAGKVSFYTDWKRCGNMQIYFNGKYYGGFPSYFSDAQPICGQVGTVTLSYKPGTYGYKVISEGLPTRTWEGTVTITGGGCSLVGFSK